MSHMGHALQNLPTDATLSEAQRKEHARIIANLPACAGNLRPAGAELERQHQSTMHQAQAKVQQMLRDTSLRFQAIERRATEAEANFRRFQSSASDSQKGFRSRREQLQNEQSIAASNHRRREQNLSS